jgi:hypothetical protein
VRQARGDRNRILHPRDTAHVGDLC